MSKNLQTERAERVQKIVEMSNGRQIDLLLEPIGLERLLQAILSDDFGCEGSEVDSES